MSDIMNSQRRFLSYGSSDLRSDRLGTMMITDFQRHPTFDAGKDEWKVKIGSQSSVQLHRPHYGIHVSLLSPIIGRYFDNVRDPNLSFDKDDTAVTLSFCRTMSESTIKRDQRSKLLKEMLCGYLEIPSDSIKPTQYRSEVYKTNAPTAATTEEEHRPVHLKSHWEGPYLGMLLSLEIRSELAGNNAVGMFAMGNYVDSLAKNLAASCNSHAPCLLLTMAGPYLNIDVAAFTTAAVIDPAVSFLPTLVNPFDSHSMIRIAQTLRATKTCLHELDAYYRNDVTEVPESERIQLAFPYMRYFVCTFLGQAVTVHFQYLRQLVHPKLVFLVKVTHVQHTLSDEQSSRLPLQVGTKFVIKFTRTYCKEAHLRCYNHKAGAPELYGIGPLPGGWLYVCMEYIERMSWLDLMYRRDVKEALRGLVAHLHSANYVHGDIKRMNVLVIEPPDRMPRVCLCDFDWAGLEGVATYPAFITPDARLPDGVEDLKSILKEHDVHAVNTGFWNHL